VVSLSLIAILFFALRSTVKRIDYNTRRYFVDKLQDYDYLKEEKKQILNKLNEQIEENKRVLNQESKEEEIVIKKENNKYYDDSIIPKYMDEDLFKKYKDIKSKFSFDNETLIRNLVNDIEKNSENNDYEILVNIRKKFTNKKIYEILKLRKNEQMKYVYNFLIEEEIKVLNKYINEKNFKINNFVTKLDTLIEKNDPIIYIYVGEKNKNYDYISNLVKTKFDDSINEGIKINYKGVIYDYSL